MNAGGAFGDIGSVIQSVDVMAPDGEVYTRHRPDLAFAYRSSNINAPFILSAAFSLSEDDPQRILKQVKQIWIYKKNTQPLAHRNAGCIFKNPRGLSAGALIDRAGMKGRRVGGAFVSELIDFFPQLGRNDWLAKVLNIEEIRFIPQVRTWFCGWRRFSV